MDEHVSAADANRQFSRLLQGVREGRSYVVTSHSRPIARLTPVEASDPVREKAREVLFERLRGQPDANIPKWARDELYEDDA